AGCRPGRSRARWRRGAAWEVLAWCGRLTAGGYRLVPLDARPRAPVTGPGPQAYDRRPSPAFLRLPAPGRHLHEPHEVVLLEELLLADLLEPAGDDLLDEHLLPGPDVAEDPLRTLARDAVEVAEDHSPAGPERLVDRLHRAEGVLEVMVGVADEDEIDGVGGEV